MPSSAVGFIVRSGSAVMSPARIIGMGVVGMLTMPGRAMLRLVVTAGVIFVIIVPITMPGAVGMADMVLVVIVPVAVEDFIRMADMAPQSAGIEGLVAVTEVIPGIHMPVGMNGRVGMAIMAGMVLVRRVVMAVTVLGPGMKSLRRDRRDNGGSQSQPGDIFLQYLGLLAGQEQRYIFLDLSGELRHHKSIQDLRIRDLALSCKALKI